MKPSKDLDEIFTKYTKQVIDMCHGNRPDVADESAKAKQAILDWHNKQVEEVLDRLESKLVERRVDNAPYAPGKEYLVPEAAIEAERNLKTGKKILLPGQKERN